jgi:hypothetical protein
MRYPQGAGYSSDRGKWETGFLTAQSYLNQKARFPFFPAATNKSLIKGPIMDVNKQIFKGQYLP